MFGLFGLIFIAIGIVNIAFPKASWYMKYGWQFKNAEPTEAALIMSRIGGVLAVVIGLIILIGGFGPFFR